MSRFSVRCEDLGKKYRIDRMLLRQMQAHTLRDALVNRSSMLVRKLSGRHRAAPGRKKREDFWALRHLDFEVQEGELVGVIGRNGAGKSTLLKLLSRITDPTEGRMMLRGRVASLLEVGTGFHPELSGRENIFLNGAILGMGRQEIHRKFDEIVAFSEVEKFLETPVKRYSSGMYVRLAFAVAAHLEPETLLVDEVLAVGDLQFQKKCIGKMEEVGKSGRTVIFVSHNMSLVNNLCRRGLLLEEGRLVFDGPVNETVEKYMSLMHTAEEVPVATEGPLLTDDDLDILDFHPCGSDGSRRAVFRTSEEVFVRIRYRAKRSLPGLRVGIDVQNAVRGEVVFRSYDDDLREWPREPGEWEALCRMPRDLLMQGVYSVQLVASIHKQRWISRGALVQRITIEQIDGVNSRYGDSRPGAIQPALEWSVRAADEGKRGISAG